MSSQLFTQKKQAQEKIAVLTCYDYTTAKILNDSTLDALLIGDSLAMTMYGFKDTVMATLTMMELHTAAVSRGARDKFIISDLPFLSYRKSLSKSVSAAETLMRAGAHALKLEGAAGNLTLISHLVESGIPVMGHLGLTPQFVHVLGGYKVQGKTVAAAERLKQDALALQEAGCFALVLECIPAPLAKEITQLLNIATIGIGAGSDTDGQVLVLQDLLGLNLDFKAKFVKHFLSGSHLLNESVNQYVQSVKQREFPSYEHCY
ncbi:3-methyl-2-oxobutanoate hydroxymethyltransferase [Candidatus Rickettsiella viridis]|uniref:3-methyl-2-oxobutanoate hydroxymethyltransferase n=1 Tax=Candidatus Rickettsiella viridis TaxID=676208 RepID=A0A2Z5UW63_9COXI|nr:3-methyl-2-oxobutanoate hydroxymethyltransferase [Candidatus Rickettsiella viridis]BBB15809.1 3-methyl-2-oxobutanoate hydroxymethyltransferase [Candidatus Rickettsiella viridis]